MPVLFEDFPDHVPSDDRATAVSGAAALDDRRDESLHSYGQRLADGVSNESGLPDTLVAIEGLVCQFMLGHNEARARHGSALTPRIEMGGQVSPPPVSVFPESARGYLTERANVASRSDVRARLHDFCWERWHDVTGARGAIDCYLEATEAVDLADPSDAGTAMEYLIRAAELALRVRHRPDDVRNRTANEIRRSIGGPNLGYPCWLLEKTTDLLEQDAALSTDLLDRAVVAASEAGARRDRHTERSYLEGALALATATKRHDQAAAFRASLAASVEAEAGERGGEGGLIEVAFLTQALKAYMDLGDAVAVQRIKARLPGANERAISEMHTFSVEVTISTDEIERSVSSMAAATSIDPAAIRAVARELGFWPAWATIVQERRDHGSVFASLASTALLEHDARSVPLPDSGPAREDALTIRQFAQRTMIGAGLAEIALRVLRNRGQWTAETVTAAIGDADPDLGRACEPGVRAFEAGEFWTALHVLAPQVERAVRLIGARPDAPIHRVTTAQRLMWALLDPMLEDPAIRATLGEDFARELQALFTSDYGPNVRNNVAHGAADLDAAAAPAMVCMMALLAVADVLARLLAGGSGEQAE